MSYFLNIDKASPSHIAAIDDQENQISYGELVAFCDGLTNKIEPRSLVFHFSENSVASLSFYIACIHNKAIPLLLSPQTDLKLIQTLVEKYQPNYIIGPLKFSEYFEAETLAEKNNYQLLQLKNPTHKVYDKLSLLLPTSGSTGSPKLVRHSYKNLEASAQSVSEFFKLKSSDKSFSFLPMYYTMGLSVIHSHLRVGATSILVNSSMTDANFWKALKKNNPTNITGVPYSYEILKKMRLFRMKLPSLRFITQGGGKLSEELYNECVDFANKNHIEFIPTYGQTEGTARMAYLEPPMAAIKIGSIGKAIPNGKLSILNENGQETVEGNDKGELVYRGPNVTLGYANDLLDLNLKDERNGILFTGDLVKRDNDGFYFITGRKSRFLKLYGIRIALDEVEKLVSSEFDVECACGGNDKKMIVLITKTDLTEKVSNFIIEKTGLFHQAFDVAYVEQIPRNETGKIVFNGRV